MMHSMKNDKEIEKEVFLNVFTQSSNCVTLMGIYNEIPLIENSIPFLLTLGFLLFTIFYFPCLNFNATLYEIIHIQVMISSNKQS